VLLTKQQYPAEMLRHPRSKRIKERNAAVHWLYEQQAMNILNRYLDKLKVNSSHPV
jgi:hypothetical protein